MENFLPALLIIGGVIYKIYSEYQKEQEKARRRVPQAPLPPSTPPVPSQKTERVRAIPEEVRKIQEKRLAEANSNKKIIVKPVVDLEKETERITTFDLLKSVSQSAILNRLYQYFSIEKSSASAKNLNCSRDLIKSAGFRVNVYKSSSSGLQYTTSPLGEIHIEPPE